MLRDFLSEDYQNPEMDKMPLRDFLEEPKQEPESLGKSILFAAPRVAEDAYKGAFNLAKKVPGYLEAAPKAISSAASTFKNDPFNAMAQQYAGLAELGQKTFNTPHDITNYLSNRLNLFPKDINQKIQMGRMPEDTQQMIDQTFGKPKNEGEEFLRGLTRNSINLSGLTGVAHYANPMRYTNSGIMRNVVNTRNALQQRYGRTYNNIFNEADINGLGSNLPNLIPHLDLQRILANEPHHSVISMNEFINNPNPRSAHEAKRDLLKTQRKLTAKNERESLSGGERDKLNAVNNAITDIEANMFTDAQGIEHPELSGRYRNTQTGYRDEVIPYTKNKAINKYRSGKLLPGEAVRSISKGEFAAQRGSHHPEITRRNFLNKVLPWVRAGGIGGASLYGLNKLINLLSESHSNQNQ